MVSKARAASRRERVAVRKEVAKAGRVKKLARRRACERACRAKRALAKAAMVAKETTVDLGQKVEAIKEKEEAIKETGSMIGGRVFPVVIATPTVEEPRVGMVPPREDKVTAMTVGLVRGAILARAAAAMLSIHYLQMIAE